MVTKYVANWNKNCYCLYDNSNEKIIFSYKEERISEEVSLIYKKGDLAFHGKEIIVYIRTEYDVPDVVYDFLYGNQIQEAFFFSLFHGVNSETGRRKMID